MILASWSHDGMACKVPCYIVGILALQERQSKRIREGKLGIMWENSWNVWSSAEGIGDVPIESLWVGIKE